MLFVFVIYIRYITRVCCSTINCDHGGKHTKTYGIHDVMPTTKHIFHHTTRGHDVLLRVLILGALVYIYTPYLELIIILRVYTIYIHNNNNVMIYIGGYGSTHQQENNQNTPHTHTHPPHTHTTSMITHPPTPPPATSVVSLCSYIFITFTTTTRPPLVACVLLLYLIFFIVWYVFWGKIILYKIIITIDDTYTTST